MGAVVARKHPATFGRVAPSLPLTASTLWLPASGLRRRKACRLSDGDPPDAERATFGAGDLAGAARGEDLTTRGLLRGPTLISAALALPRSLGDLAGVGAGVAKEPGVLGE